MKHEILLYSEKHATRVEDKRGLPVSLTPLKIYLFIPVSLVLKYFINFRLLQLQKGLKYVKNEHFSVTVLVMNS